MKTHCFQISVCSFLKLKSRTLCMIMLLPKVRLCPKIFVLTEERGLFSSKMTLHSRSSKLQMFYPVLIQGKITGTENGEI